MKSIHNETISTFVFRIIPFLFRSCSCDKVEKKVLAIGWLAFDIVVDDIGQIKSTEIVSPNTFHTFVLICFSPEKLLETNQSLDQFMESEKRKKRKGPKKILLNVMRKWTTRISHIFQYGRERSVHRIYVNVGRGEFPEENFVCTKSCGVWFPLSVRKHSDLPLLLLLCAAVVPAIKINHESWLAHLPTSYMEIRTVAPLSTRYTIFCAYKYTCGLTSLLLCVATLCTTAWF